MRTQALIQALMNFNPYYTAPGQQAPNVADAYRVNQEGERMRYQAAMNDYNARVARNNQRQQFISDILGTATRAFFLQG